LNTQLFEILKKYKKKTLKIGSTKTIRIKTDLEIDFKYREELLKVESIPKTMSKIFKKIKITAQRPTRNQYI